VRLGILPIGHIDATVPLHIRKSLVRILPDLECLIIPEEVPLLKRAFDMKRKQYRSNLILGEMQAYGAKQKDLDCILGVVDADIFVPELRFVFGEACFPGKVALISLWRLKPEFYGDAPDETIFLSRVVKESVHEIGHTLGLRHCFRHSCVMHFSNSIFDTDIKQTMPCDECYTKAAIRIDSLRLLPE
jgi:archaemetzincin